MDHRISAGAIIERDGRILMVRHVRPGLYDFWVCPGGGVKDDESLEQAAMREVREESGLDVSIGRLLYIEELVNPECRHVEFWFEGTPCGGAIDVSHPEAVAEHVVEARWLAPAEFEGRVVFPPVLADRYAHDRDAGFGEVIRLPLRRMQFW